MTRDDRPRRRQRRMFYATPSLRDDDDEERNEEGGEYLFRQFVREQQALRKDFNQWTAHAATKSDVAELKAQLASLLPRETWDLYHKQVVEDVQQQTQRLTSDEARIEKLQEKIHAMELDDANRVSRLRLDAQQQVGQVAQSSAAGIAQTRSAFDEAINKALLIITGALASGLIAAVIALANSKP